MTTRRDISTGTGTSDSSERAGVVPQARGSRCHCDGSSHDVTSDNSRSSQPVYEELICEVDSDVSVDISDAIDLCDDTDDEVIEVGVNVPGPSPGHSPISPMHIFPFGFEARPTDNNVTRGLIHMPFSNDPDVESIFARIQQHLRNQAAILGHVGLFGIDIPPRIPPERIIDKLLTKRVASPTEAHMLGSCPICLEAYRPRMLVRILPGCGHMVHKGCMDKWILKSRKYTCPLDNLPITVDEIAVRDGPSPPRSLRVPEPPATSQASPSPLGIRRSGRPRRAPRH